MSPDNSESTKDTKLLRFKEIALSAPGAQFIPSGIKIRELDFSTIPDERNRKDIEGFVKYAADYVQRPIYINHFDRHEERSAWEEKTEMEVSGEFGTQQNPDLETGREFINFINNTRASANSIKQFESQAANLEYYGLSSYIPSEPLGKIREIIREKIDTKFDENFNEVDPWEQLSDQEKINTINELTDLAIKILRHFEVKS